MVRVAALSLLTAIDFKMESVRIYLRAEFTLILIVSDTLEGRIEKGTVETFSSHHIMRHGNENRVAGISVHAALSDRFFFSKWNSIDL